ncbi:hypothetical protein [Desulfolithobacter sp.]
MSETEPGREQKTVRRKKSSPWPIIWLGCLLLAGLAVALGWYLIREQKTASLVARLEEPLETVPAEEEVPEPEPPSPENRTAPEPPAPAPESQTPPQLPRTEKENIQIQPGPAVEPPPPAPVLTKEEQECRELALRLHDFFTSLDKKEYIREFQLGRPSQEYFRALADKLLDNPPVVTREYDDLYTMLKNMAHFFRIIGKNNILLLKAIFDREGDRVEDVAADLYRWATLQCKSDRFSFVLPLDKLYEYAGFFLNTIGGRSYLFRRDSQLRLLVNYYSILIIDWANREDANRYGIDIRQILPQLTQEIETSNQLVYKERYLDRLYELREQYQ